MQSLGSFTLLLHDALLLLAVINPLGNIPVYRDLTTGMDPGKRRTIIRLGVGTAWAMIIGFALLGDWSLKNLFEVTLDEFRIAGGILLFIVAVRGVMTGSLSYNLLSDDFRTRAIFPLAFPIIVGPGTLAVTIILAQNRSSIHMLSVSVASCLIVYLIACSAHSLMRFIGGYAAMIIPRLLYIFLAAKAVSLTMRGLTGFLQEILRQAT
jgi:multiple antibiotic resistance protein